MIFRVKGIPKARFVRRRRASSNTLTFFGVFFFKVCHEETRWNTNADRPPWGAAIQNGENGNSKPNANPDEKTFPSMNCPAPLIFCFHKGGKNCFQTMGESCRLNLCQSSRVIVLRASQLCLNIELTQYAGFCFDQKC